MSLRDVGLRRSHSSRLIQPKELRLQVYRISRRRNPTKRLYTPGKVAHNAYPFYIYG